MICFLSIKHLKLEYNWFEGKIAFTSYLETNLMYYKLVVINLICFIWGNSFTKNANSYHLLVTGYQGIKLKYILSKLLMLIIITISLIFISFYLMTLIGVLCCNFVSINKIIFELFINVLLICIIYGLLSSVFTILINNQYACFLSSGIFVLCELISDSFNDIKLFYVFFPGLSLNYDLCFGIIHLLFISIIYVFLVVLVYLYKK
ncbi:MAG: hypothetical protein E7183_06720 [Erysipelotrichaceae bacterium]|nr:hypothetical protein [Erysipelotrichaceae bacterium]